MSRDNSHPKPELSSAAGVFMGQFSTQGFPPGAGGAAPTGALTSAEALPNGGYMAPNQGQAQGQWSVNQVTGELIILRRFHPFSFCRRSHVFYLC